MPNLEPELLLCLLAEGGGVEILRWPEADGSWRFSYRSMGCSGFDRSDFFEDEESVVGPTVPEPPVRTLPANFSTVEEAIVNCSSDGSWVRWSVFEIHPDYIQNIWQLRERTIESAEESRARNARSVDGEWADACGYKLPKNDSSFQD